MCIWVVFRDKFYCNRNQSVRKKRHKTLEERCCHRCRRRRRRREPSARTGRARAGVGAGASGETLFGSGCLDAYVHPDACAIADLMGARGAGPPPSIGDAAPDGKAGGAAGPPSDGGGEVQCHRPPGKGAAKSRVTVPVHTHPPRPPSPSAHPCPSSRLAPLSSLMMP